MKASVIIPTFNRYIALLETLEELSKIDYPNNQWEAVIVDDGSTDQTENAVANWIKTGKIQTQYIRQDNKGAAAARNCGAWSARGEILIFIDNDILPPTNFIHQHLESLNNNPKCWILGRIVHPTNIRQTPFGRYRDDFHESFYRSVLPDQLTETNGMSAANVSIPKADFIALDGFDESYPGASCEDWELAWRARLNGIRVMFHPGISVLHNDWAVSLQQFCRRQKMYCIPQVLLWKNYGEASPWTKLINENAHIDWQTDSFHLILKKSLKGLFASDLGERFIQHFGLWIEKIAPDTKLSHRAYNLAIGVAILRGVREGLQRYAVNMPLSTSALTVKTLS